MKIVLFPIIPLLAVDIYHVPPATCFVSRSHPSFFLLFLVPTRADASGNRALDVTLVPSGYACRV